MTTELQQIAKRIRQRAEAEDRDRARQRELLREGVASGRTWSSLIEEAQIARPTLAAALDPTFKERRKAAKRARSQ